MDELTSLKKLCHDSEMYGMVTFLVGPDGSIIEYTRLIDKEFMENITKEQFQFYTDDMGCAMLKELSAVLDLKAFLVRPTADVPTDTDGQQ